MKIARGRRNIPLCVSVVAIVCILLLAGCSTSKTSTAQTRSVSARKSTSTIETTTSLSGAPGSIQFNESASFHDQVQQICDSVDPQTFIDLLSLDLSKDRNYQPKFDSALKELGRLSEAFSRVRSVPNIESWNVGLSDLASLSTQIQSINNQFDEYFALEAELKTNKDLKRGAEIISRQLTLVGEFATALSQVHTSYNDLISIGADAGIPRCKALTT